MNLDIVRCPNGHFYNRSTHSICPTCNASANLKSVDTVPGFFLNASRREVFLPESINNCISFTIPFGCEIPVFSGMFLRIDDAYLQLCHPFYHIGSSKSCEICLEHSKISDLHGVLLNESGTLSLHLVYPDVQIQTPQYHDRWYPLDRPVRLSDQCRLLFPGNFQLEFRMMRYTSN